MNYIPGQRWISEADLQLGLGMIARVDARTVDVLFPASGEQRTYARQSAPLARVEFSPGDEVTSIDGWTLSVDSAEEVDGLLVYIGHGPDGKPALLEETRLSGQIQLNRPLDRLFSGQLDHPKWFQLRSDTLRYTDELAHTRLRGLTGGRTSLIPHQLYVAHEVSQRLAPRVLLADEVGLGKTIEAGMILHAQLLSEQAQRVLILVPETLLHQWLVEMLRRFNLRFSLFDAARCEALQEENPTLNPFETEQLILAPTGLFTEHPELLDQALATTWDLLIVDEAHHLQWSPQQASPDYCSVEQLAQHSPSVLLLTATPEQLGKASHFARLRLLDADRFPDLDRFLQEESGYEPIARAIEALIDAQPLSPADTAVLETTLGEGDNLQPLKLLLSDTTSEDARQGARDTLIAHLLDRHGTGRLLFRNTRAAVHGFPGRAVHFYPLDLPTEYHHLLQTSSKEPTQDLQQLLSLEQRYAPEANQSEHWYDIDPRVDWLIEQLRTLGSDKALVITAYAKTALDLAEALRLRTGLHVAVFHEGMSIVERDRAAAYFADTESGTPALICSEIGSEGRNFQFAHHLLLFDLPLNPDLLEQRIGRLDRIGQTQTIQIHVPYLTDSPQEVMAHWYHHGLNAFAENCPAGASVYAELTTDLSAALKHIELEEKLLKKTQALHQALSEQLQHGRDRLLEYNSCRPAQAAALVAEAENSDWDNDLPTYLERVCDCYGINFEDDTATSFILTPGTHMQTHNFPGLPEDGMTATFDRDTALANEDMQFLTWEHPLLVGAMDMLLASERGNTAFSAIRAPGVKAGLLFLETLFVLDSPALQSPRLKRYLPPSQLRLVIDDQGKQYAERLTPEKIEQLTSKVTGSMAREIIKACQADLKRMAATATQMAEAQAPQLIETALTHSDTLLLEEINRLHALQKINRNIRPQEIELFERERGLIAEALQSAGVQLDALRVIVTA